MIHEFAELKGSILTQIEGAEPESREMTITTDEGRQFRFFHYQDCCEDVYLIDVCGDITDLLDMPLLQAEVVTSNNHPEEILKKYGCYPEWYSGTPNDDWYKGPLPEWAQDSYTWTFYKFATHKGAVTIRWWGTSNGYYSEEVEFKEVTKERTT